MRAFKDGYVPSVTNGAIMELNYGLGRESPQESRTPFNTGSLRGKADAIHLGTDNVNVSGWAVDPLLPQGGKSPITIVISVDGVAAVSVLANHPRHDLVAAGVATNPEHGFSTVLPAQAAHTLLSEGRHVLAAMAIGGPNCPTPTGLPQGYEIAVCDGKLCE